MICRLIINKKRKEFTFKSKHFSHPEGGGVPESSSIAEAEEDVEENEEAEDVKHPNRSKVEVFISMNPSSSSSSSLKTEILLPLFLSWETWSQEYISIEDAAMLNKWSNLFRSKLTPDP